MYLRNDRQVDIEIECLNQTLFYISFESAHNGIVKIDDLQTKVFSNDKRTCSPSGICNYTITLADKDIVDLTRDSISKNKLIKLFLVFNLGGIVDYEKDKKPESSNSFDVQCSINKLVLPEKI